MLYGDWFKHYTGWLHFSHEAWSWPWVRIHSLLWPIGTSVTAMDSLPLMALLFKLFRNFLPPDSQYFGIWLLICFAL